MWPSLESHSSALQQANFNASHGACPLIILYSKIVLIKYILSLLSKNVHVSRLFAKYSALRCKRRRRNTV